MCKRWIIIYFWSLVGKKVHLKRFLERQNKFLVKKGSFVSKWCEKICAVWLGIQAGQQRGLDAVEDAEGLGSEGDVGAGESCHDPRLNALVQGRRRARAVGIPGIGEGGHGGKGGAGCVGCSERLGMRPVDTAKAQAWQYLVHCERSLPGRGGSNYKRDSTIDWTTRRLDYGD